MQAETGKMQAETGNTDVIFDIIFDNISRMMNTIQRYIIGADAGYGRRFSWNAPVR